MPRMEWLGRELVRDPPPPSLYPGFPALHLIALIASNIVLLSLDRHQLNIMASGYGINGGAKAPFPFPLPLHLEENSPHSWHGSNN